MTPSHLMVSVLTVVLLKSTSMTTAEEEASINARPVRTHLP